MHDWDLVERHVPPEALRIGTSENDARLELVCQAVANAPLCTAREVALLFGWQRTHVEDLLGVLARDGTLTRNSVEGRTDIGYRVLC